MADDLLSALTSNENSDEDAVLHINPEDRTIRIPKDFVFGVYNDKDVLAVPFTIPRYYGENDLSDFTFTINYINAAGLGNIYDIVDLEVGKDRIDFTWTLGRAVFVTKGAVRFVVCIRKIGSNGRIEKELNTRIYVAEVLAGLEVDDNPDPEAYSILANMTELEASTKRLHDFVSNKASEIANITGEATRVLNEANDKLDEAIEGIDRVEEMFGSPLVAATASAMTDQTRIYVYTGSETGYTAGNWYYYNGSAWTSGGVYNSQGINTDTTLTMAGMAADAKKTGDEITLVKQDITSLNDMADNLVETSQTQGWVKLYSATENTQSSGLTVMDALIRSPNDSYPGRINNTTGKKTFWFQVSTDMQIYVTGETPLRLRVTTEVPTAGNAQSFTGDLYASDNNTLPTASNPASVATGKYVAFCSNNTSFSVDLYSLEESFTEYTLKSTVGMTDKMQDEINYEITTQTASLHNSSDVFAFTWGVGSFTNTTGADIRGNLNGGVKRRSTPVIQAPYPIAVGNTFAYPVRISVANSQYEIVEKGTFSAGDFVVFPANTPFRITARNQSDTDITDVTDATLNSNIYVRGLFPNGYAPVKWCAMGDSITLGWHSEYVEGDTTESEKDSSIGWASNVAMINGWNITNLAIGSTGWLDTVQSGVYDTAGFYIGTHTDFTPYNLVTLAYGVNDWKADLPVGSYTDAPDGNTPTTVMQAMRMTIEGIMTSNPECKIIVILPLNCVGYSYSYGDKTTNYGLGYAFTNSGTLESFVQKMIEVCNYYGIQYIDQTHYSCINRENLLTMLPDGVHPSKVAHTILGNELSKKITF